MAMPIYNVTSSAAQPGPHIPMDQLFPRSRSVSLTFETCHSCVPFGTLSTAMEVSAVHCISDSLDDLDSSLYVYTYILYPNYLKGVTS